jgi:hypothetical protein
VFANLSFKFYLLLLIVFFTILEIRIPYFFLQDDNYSQFYPVISNGLDFIYSSGKIPFYSFIHGNGVPIFESFQYGFLDPILHLAYWICLMIDLPFALFDIYCFIYFAIITYITHTLLNKNTFITITLLFAFLFSGHILITLRSWYYLCPYIALLSIIFWRAKKTFISNSFTIKFYPESLWIGVSIFFGNPQFYFYTIGIYLLFFIINGILNNINIKTILASIGLNFIPIFIFSSIALLLFLNNPQISARNYFIFEGINLFTLTQMFIPPLKGLFTGYYEAPTVHWEYYFMCPLVLVGFYLAIFKNLPKLFQKYKINKEYHFDLYLSIIAIACFILMTPVFFIFKFIPLLSKFHKSFKLYYIFLFSTSVIGARFLQKKPPFKNYIIGGTIIYVLYIVLFLNKGFYDFTISQKDPYQVTNRNFTHFFNSNSKIYSIAPLRSSDQSFPNSMNLNFGLVHHVPTINAYEPMADSRRINLNEKELIELGATHLLLYKEDLEAKNKNKWDKEYLNSYTFFNNFPPAGSSLIFSNKNIKLYKLSHETLIKKVNFGINKIEFILNRSINLKQFPIKLSYNRKIIGDVHGKPIRIKAKNELMVIDEPIVSDRFTLNYSIWEGGPASKLMNKLFY